MMASAEPTGSDHYMSLGWFSIMVREKRERKTIMLMEW
jgi:hypothetical protein